LRQALSNKEEKEREITRREREREGERKRGREVRECFCRSQFLGR